MVFCKSYIVFCQLTSLFSHKAVTKHVYLTENLQPSPESPQHLCRLHYPRGHSKRHSDSYVSELIYDFILSFNFQDSISNLGYRIKGDQTSDTWDSQLSRRAYSGYGDALSFIHSFVHYLLCDLAFFSHQDLLITYSALGFQEYKDRGIPAPRAFTW